MSHRTRLALAALTAALLLAVAVSTAGANTSITVAPGGAVTAVSGALHFNSTGLAAATGITCAVTLLRTISRTISKVAGSLFGKVTGVAINLRTCRTGFLIGTLRLILALRGLGSANCSAPVEGILLCDVSGAAANLWKLVYDSFQGTLPEIRGINFHIQGTQFSIDTNSGFRCLFVGDAYGLIAIERRVVTGARAVLERTILARDNANSLNCPFDRGTFNGSFSISPGQTIALI